ncbi:MAG: hypothetical protein R6U44_01970 [Archaeoglobaceae archaeon]
MERITNINSDSILGIESIIFLSAFIFSFLFVVEYVPVFFAFLITLHELSYQMERGIISNMLQSIYKKFYNIYSLTLFD